MRRSIITFLFILATTLSFSQKIEIEYNVRLNSIQKIGNLIYSPTDTIYYYEKRNNNLSKKNNIDLEGDDAYTITINSNIDKKNYQVFLPNINTIISQEYINDNSFYVYENIPQLNWKFENEVKVISGYTCNKATTLFRGRKYEAWFTTDIACNYGPWKFNGLPGLILEIYDESKSFSWVVAKIDNIFKVQNLVFDKNVEKLNLRAFIKKSEQAKKEKSKQMIMRILPRGTEIPDPQYNRGRELVFEWEDEKED